MKKIYRIIGILLLFCLVFAVGYLGCRKIGFMGKKQEIRLFMETNNARNVIKWEADIEEEDAQLIEEHVFGEWKIRERIMELESDNNISTQGIEEMKNLVFIYDKNFVRIDGYEQCTFSDRDDLFLFQYYGGNYGVKLPVYHVNRDVDECDLGGQGDYGQFPKECELVKVDYDLGYDLSLYPSVLYGTRYAGEALYVDSEDKDTLYLDMCGLWELKRCKVVDNTFQFEGE